MGAVAVQFYFLVIVVVALVINNLFVALVCFGFSQARTEIAKELELLKTIDSNKDGQSTHGASAASAHGASSWLAALTLS